MIRKMVVNAADPEEVRVAILDDGRLEDFDIETRGAEKNKGNIYKARVVAVEPALNAAFVDYGADKQGFLTAGDVDPRLSKRDNLGRNPAINELLTAGQSILVQITKDEVGAKGAVLTTYLSLAGRYLVLTPESTHAGISRKIDDEEERRAMREAVEALRVPEGMGVILRTAGRERPVEDLKRDLEVLMRLWDNIKAEAGRAKAPALIFKESDVIIRALRDYFSEDIDEIILDTDEAYDRAAEYMNLVMPQQYQALTRYVERRPIFHHYKIEDQLDALFTPRVSLPAGGSIVIEQAEALVAIDVNSGKQKAGGHEETALQTNLEAAREIARQLRLRDLGGIIVVDFIDMAMRKNQARVENAMREALRNDKARVKVGRISRNGTLELTRQRIRTALAASVFRTCAVCHGTGRILNPTSHATAVLRRLLDRASRSDLARATIRLEPEAANVLRTSKWSQVQDVEQKYEMQIDIVPERGFSPGQDDFTFETRPGAVAVEPEAPNFGPAWVPEEVRAEREAAAKARAEAAAAAAAARAAETGEIPEDAIIDIGGPAPEEGEGRRGRRRRRGRDRDRERGGERPSTPRAEESLGMPTFELVDPAEIGLGRDGGREERSGERHEEGASGEGREGRRRRRRRGRGRGGEPRMPGPGVGPQPAMPSAAAVASAQMPAAEAPKKKKGFFAWLFGMGE